MRQVFFCFFVLIVGLFLRTSGEAQSLYDTLQQETAAIPQEWRRERLPTLTATQKAQDIISLIHSPEKVSPTRKATRAQFKITAKALVASTLYDVRRAVVEKKRTFRLPRVPQGASPQFIEHLGIVGSIILITREIHQQLLDRMVQPFGDYIQYPFDQTDFGDTLKGNILAKLSFFKHTGYTATIKKVLEREGLLRSLFKWFAKLDSQYDIKNVEDLKKEVTAISKGRKGRTENFKAYTDGRQYTLYKDEFGCKVAFFKPNNPKGATHIPSTVRENENFEVINKIAPDCMAANYLVTDGLIEQFIPFVDREEARFLLLKTEGGEDITYAYFTLCAAFQIAYRTINTHFLFVKNFPYSIRKCLHSSDSSRSLYNLIPQLTGHHSWSLAEWLKPISTNIWDLSYWKGDLDYEKKDLKAVNQEEYKYFQEVYTQLAPAFQSYQNAMKIFAQALAASTPCLGEDIYRYLCINYMLQVQDAHAGNVMMGSRKGRLKLVIIDTEFSHGVYQGINFMSPDIMTLLPPFKGDSIEVSWKTPLREALNKLQAKSWAFDLTILKQKATNFLTHPSKTLRETYKSLIMRPRNWGMNNPGFPYTLGKRTDYILYRALEENYSPLYL